MIFLAFMFNFYFSNLNKKALFLCKIYYVMDKKKYLILLLFIVTIFNSSCTYNNIEDFCSEAEICDTLMVSFSEDILPIFNFHCKSCHSGAQPAGSLILTNHQEIEPEINNDNIINRITKDNSDNLLMPPAGKLDDCLIEKIIA